MNGLISVYSSISYFLLTLEERDMKQIKTGFLKTCIGLTLVVGTMANANFGDPTSMMSSFGGQNFAQPQTQTQM